MKQDFFIHELITDACAVPPATAPRSLQYLFDDIFAAAPPVQAAVAHEPFSTDKPGPHEANDEGAPHCNPSEKANASPAQLP